MHTARSSSPVRATHVALVALFMSVCTGCSSEGDATETASGGDTETGAEAGTGADGGNGDDGDGGEHPEDEPTIRVVVSTVPSTSNVGGADSFIVDIIDGTPRPPVAIHPPSTAAAAYQPALREATDRWLPVVRNSTAPSLASFLLVDLETPAPHVDNAIVVEEFDGDAPDWVSVSPNRDVLVISRSESGGAENLWAIRFEDDMPLEPVRLHDRATPGNGVPSFAWSPDGRHYAWMGSVDDGRFRVVVGQTAPFSVDEQHEIGVYDGRVSPFPALKWVGDGSWLTWSIDDDDDFEEEIFVVDVSDPSLEPVRFDPGDIDVDHSGYGLTFAPDMSSAVFYGDAWPYDDLYFVTFDGQSFGTPVRVESSEEGGDVTVRSARYLGDLPWIVYGRVNENKTRRPMAVDIRGGAPAVPVPLVSLATPLSAFFEASSTDGSLVYLAVESHYSYEELIRVHFDASGPGASEPVDEGFVPIRVYDEHPYADRTWRVAEYGDFEVIGWRTIDFDDPQAQLESVATTPPEAIMDYYAPPQQVPGTDAWMVRATRNPSNPDGAASLRYIPAGGDSWGVPAFPGASTDFMIRVLDE